MTRRACILYRLGLFGELVISVSTAQHYPVCVEDIIAKPSAKACGMDCHALRITHWSSDPCWAGRFIKWKTTSSYDMWPVYCRFSDICAKEHRSGYKLSAEHPVLLMFGRDMSRHNEDHLFGLLTGTCTIMTFKHSLYWDRIVSSLADTKTTSSVSFVACVTKETASEGQHNEK